jgi:hypothetical protein
MNIIYTNQLHNFILKHIDAHFNLITYIIFKV